ncbi:MAG: MFS transporter [Candidatus Nanopelagicales bacterium]
MTDDGVLHRPVRPVRDRTTLLAYAQLGLLGWFIYAFGASVTLLRDDEGLTRTAASTLSIALAVGGTLGSFVAAPVVRRWGRGLMLRAGAVFVAVGSLIYISDGPLWIVVLGPFIGSLGASFCAVGVSAYLEARQGAAADASLAEANLVASSASLLGILAVGVGATTILGWRLGLILLVIVVIALELLRGRSLQPFNVGTEMESRTDAPRLPRLVWWAVITLILLTSVEITLLQWGPDLLRARGGLEAGAASATIAAVVIGMIIGRLVGSRIVERVSSELVFGGSIIFAAAAFAFTWLVTGVVPLIIGLTLIGVGIGMHFPLGIGRAMRASAGQPDRAAGWTSAGIGIMSGIAPFALAALADAWGVHNAFALMLVFFGASFALLLWKRVPEDLPA